MTTYYRRVLTLEVLSDRRTDELSMADLAYEITDGDASGAFLSDTTTEIGPEAMIGLLITQGSDPEFLLGNNDEPYDPANLEHAQVRFWTAFAAAQTASDAGDSEAEFDAMQSALNAADSLISAEYDTASSASRQHFIDTGRYLRHGEADDGDARLIRKFNDDDDEVPVQDDVWNNDLVQFARLLAEIVANQDDLDIDALCKSMDLPASRVHELLDRADAVWNDAKASRSFGDVA
jgi:hypothetical protein